MAKPLLPKLALGLIMLLLIAGIGYESFRAWRNTMETEFHRGGESVTADHPTEDEPSSSNIDSSNWTTYSDSEFGFELRYPPDWSLAQLSDEDNVIFQVPTRPGYQGIFGIYPSLPVTEEQSLTEMKREWRKFTSQEVREIRIGDGIGLESAGILCEVARPCIIRFVFGNNELSKRGVNRFFFIISSQSDNVTPEGNLIQPHANPRQLFPKDLQKVREVLATIRFIDIEPYDTSSWQIYNNEEYVFQIKYPPALAGSVIRYGNDASGGIFFTRSDQDGLYRRFDFNARKYWKVVSEDQTSLEKIADTCEPPAKGVQVGERTEQEIDGVRFTRDVVLDYRGRLSVVLYTGASQDICYRFRYRRGHDLDASNPNDLDLFEEIVSTFTRL